MKLVIKTSNKILIIKEFYTDNYLDLEIAIESFKVS